MTEFFFFLGEVLKGNSRNFSNAFFLYLVVLWSLKCIFICILNKYSFIMNIISFYVLYIFYNIYIPPSKSSNFLLIILSDYMYHVTIDHTRWLRPKNQKILSNSKHLLEWPTSDSRFPLSAILFQFLTSPSYFNFIVYLDNQKTLETGKD